MNIRKITLTAVLVAGMSFLSGAGWAAELPSSPDGGECPDQAPTPPDDGEGDADDLGIYIQPMDPQVEVSQSDARGAHREIEREPAPAKRWPLWRLLFSWWRW